MVFSQMKKLSNVLIKKIDKIEVEANKCQKVRAVVSSCTACLDICPVNSIEISQDSIELKDSCLDCGLCTAVCLTNALKWNHPPHLQLLNQLKRLSNSENEVYLTCSSVKQQNVKSNVVEVPCLGMLPIEFWMSAGLDVPHLRIVYQAENCKACKLSVGEGLFLEQKVEAENRIKARFSMIGTVHHDEKGAPIDHRRRKFLTSLIEEVKEYNTITVKEVLEVDKTLSPFEKFDRYYEKQHELQELVDSAEEIKEKVVDKLLNDNVITTDKRALLFKVFEKKPELAEQLILSIPDIKESCTHCGACAFLCPTDAISMDKQSMILSTHKCISCGLCEEICYVKHIGSTNNQWGMGKTPTD